MRRFCQWLLDPDGYGLLGIIAIFLLIWIPVLIVATWNEDGGPHPPEGCTYIDMNPSKGSDYQLACVEGYGWDQ